jgi:hypothetical protein
MRLASRATWRVYAPKRLRRAILIDVDERSTSDLLALLSAIETCIAAIDITSVRVELDGRQYTLTSR